IEANRPPLFSFLPSAYTFTHAQLERIRDGSYDYLFIDRGRHTGGFLANSPELRDTVNQLLSTSFEREAEGVDLVVYHRSSHESSPLTPVRVDAEPAPTEDPTHPAEHLIDDNSDTFWS